MKAAIAIDRWKFKIFKKGLDSAGYEFTQVDGFTPDTIILKIETDRMVDLATLVKKMNNEAKRSKQH